MKFNGKIGNRFADLKNRYISEKLKVQPYVNARLTDVQIL